MTRSRQVTDAYIKGIEDRIAQNKPVGNVASVASFFLSRIDTVVDPLLEQIIDRNREQAELAKSAYGQTAIISAKIAYQNYKKTFKSDMFSNLIKEGAHAQRLLWASTGRKNPKFSELKYVEQIIGQDTVNTLPIETFNSYRDAW